MSKRSRRYLIFILVFVLFFDSILIGMYLMIHAKGDKAENKDRMGQVEQKVESVKVTKQKKGNSLLVLVNKDNKMPEDFHLPLVCLKNGKFVAKKCMPHLGLCGLIVKEKIRVTQLLFPVLTAVMQNKAYFCKRRFKKMSDWE